MRHAVLAAVSGDPAPGPIITGIMVTNDTGEIARVDLNGKASVTSVLPDGKRLTVFADGRVRIEPAVNPIGRKGRPKGYNQT